MQQLCIQSVVQQFIYPDVVYSIQLGICQRWCPGLRFENIVTTIEYMAIKMKVIVEERTLNSLTFTAYQVQDVLSRGKRKERKGRSVGVLASSDMVEVPLRVTFTFLRKEEERKRKSFSDKSDPPASLCLFCNFQYTVPLSHFNNSFSKHLESRKLLSLMQLKCKEQSLVTNMSTYLISFPSKLSQKNMCKQQQVNCLDGFLGRVFCLSYTFSEGNHI